MGNKLSMYTCLKYDVIGIQVYCILNSKLQKNSIYVRFWDNINGVFISAKVLMKMVTKQTVIAE